MLVLKALLPGFEKRGYNSTGSSDWLPGRMTGRKRISWQETWRAGTQHSVTGPLTHHPGLQGSKQSGLGYNNGVGIQST